MKAWQLLEREGAWTRKVSETADGREVSYDHPDAIKFGVPAAIAKCISDPKEYREAHQKIRKSLGFFNFQTTAISDWNKSPERTQAEVVAKLKELDL